MDVLSTEKKALLLGNEAIVRGAIESGIDVATTYPGTPSSEIADTFSKIARYYKGEGKEPGFYFQYSVNEKVALEVAAAAAVSGLRAMTCMKHVGLNVASDAFMTYMYVGCKGGHVIVTADDPSCHSSQNEQDNRYYAKFGNAPLLEPSTPQEAKDMTMEAFEISEELSLPILFRMTTRTSHIRGEVPLGKINLKKKKGKFEKNPLMVTVPEVARKLHPILLEKMERAEKISEKSRFNRIEEFGGSKGIITSGAPYNYVREVINELGIKCRVLKLGMTNPLPRKMLTDFLK
ncbi:MAG: indolepyruvate ferredoxin oxidoreductase subunit alpha, partial [Nitrospiraceae bacterium]|nr:indolepyruvate ferredoxin oxidoreductase subunit alpha [Nitrospiraceae bacterium]